LYLLGRVPRSHDHATDRVGVDAYRHEYEAIAELAPKSLAQHVDDRLLRRVEDERDRPELEGLDPALVELCELGDEWKETAKGLDVARQDGQLGSEILDPRRQRFDQRHERLQLAPDVVQRRRLDGRHVRGRVAGKREQALELSEHQVLLVPALGAFVPARERRELEGRLLKGADEFEQPHPVQAAQDRLDVSFPADHLHLRHGDEHRLTPRSCWRPAG
jgi:hypothetical protein